MVKEICRDGQVAGNKTNHSLRATGVSTLFQAGVPEKVIQQRSGHLSLDGLRQYQRTTVDQHEAVSKVLASTSTLEKKVVRHQEVVTQMPQMNFSSCSVNIYNCPPPPPIEGPPQAPFSTPLLDITNTECIEKTQEIEP